jgi:hypothetical protein
MKPAPPAPRRDTNQQPDRRWEKRPREEVHAAGPSSLEPKVRLAEANGHWMTSSTPSARTTRTCARPYRTVGTSSTLSDTANRSSLYHLPHRDEGLASLGSLSNKKGEGAEHSHALIGRSMSSSEDTDRRRTGGSRS